LEGMQRAARAVNRTSDAGRVSSGARSGKRLHCIEGFAKGVLMAVNILYMKYCTTPVCLESEVGKEPLQVAASSCFSSVALCSLCSSVRSVLCAL
jgi:hypothetical protein